MGVEELARGLQNLFSAFCRLFYCTGHVTSFVLDRPSVFLIDDAVFVKIF
jgi:hypothetical protein